MNLRDLRLIKADLCTFYTAIKAPSIEFIGAIDMIQEAVSYPRPWTSTLYDS